MTGSGSNGAGWARFSLREILIAVVAICALLALYMSRTGSVPTPFLASLDVDVLLEAIYADEGLGFFAYSGSGGSGASRDHASRESVITVKPQSAAEFQSRAMPEFLERVESELRSSGCRITGRGKSGSEGYAELHSFAFRYARGRVRGVFRAHSVPRDEGRIELLVFVDEW